MAKYRKRPIVIEAEQWFPGIEIEGVHTISGASHGIIRTLEGKMDVMPGDWVITGIQGEKYPIKDDIFALTYEPV